VAAQVEVRLLHSLHLYILEVQVEDRPERPHHLVQQQTTQVQVLFSIHQRVRRVIPELQVQVQAHREQLEAAVALAV